MSAKTSRRNPGRKGTSKVLIVEKTPDLEWFAHVVYDDKERTVDTVPASYIKGLSPPVFDTKKQYDVFYSSDKLKTFQWCTSHLKDIPKFPAGSGDKGPGYYKARIVILEESERAVEEKVKLVSVRKLIAQRTTSVATTSSNDSGISSHSSAVKGIKRQAQASSSDLEHSQSEAGASKLFKINDKEYEQPQDDDTPESISPGPSEREKQLEEDLKKSRERVRNLRLKVEKLEKEKQLWEKDRIQMTELQGKCDRLEKRNEHYQDNIVLWMQKTASCNCAKAGEKVVAASGSANDFVVEQPARGMIQTESLPNGDMLLESSDFDLSQYLDTQQELVINGVVSLEDGRVQVQPTHGARPAAAANPPPAVQQPAAQPPVLPGGHGPDGPQVAPVQPQTPVQQELAGGHGPAGPQVAPAQPQTPVQQELAGGHGPAGPQVAPAQPQTPVQDEQPHAAPGVNNQALATENDPIEEIVIDPQYPEILVDSRAWTTDFKNFVLNPIKNYSYGDKGDKEFIKDAAMVMWGAAKLRAHSISGKLSNAALKRNPNAPKPGPPLPSHELRAIQKALQRRVRIEAALPVPPNQEREKKTYEARTTIAVVNFEVGQKRHALLRVKNPKL